MIRTNGRWTPRVVVLPIGLLLGFASIPLVFLLIHLSGVGLAIEWSSFGRTLGFAVGGAAIAPMTGGAIGVLSGLRTFPRRRGLLALAIVPIAAPPAFWWIGATRMTSAWGNANGPGPAAVVAGLALSPVTLLLVFAALRQMPSNLYESARVARPPAARLHGVLLPLLRAPLAGGFVLTVILLLGESELPFLFGFRTVMTDVVTTFSQTFDVGKIVPIVIPLLLAILALGILAGRPIMRTVLTSSRGTHGVVRCCSRSDSEVSIGAGPDNCRVANNSAWRLSARWRGDLRSCCWTSRFRLWIRRRKIRCTTCFARSRHVCQDRQSTSRITSTMRLAWRRR